MNLKYTTEQPDQ